VAIVVAAYPTNLASLLAKRKMYFLLDKPYHSSSNNLFSLVFSDNTVKAEEISVYREITD